MTEWLEDVARLEGERERAAHARLLADREIFETTRGWLRAHVEPALGRFADDLRSIGRVVDVTVSGTVGRVQVRRHDGLAIEFAAEIGTASESSTEVEDRFPTMTPVFHGVDRLDVRSERIYELLKFSYLTKMQVALD